MCGDLILCMCLDGEFRSIQSHYLGTSNQLSELRSRRLTPCISVILFGFFSFLNFFFIRILTL